MAMSLLFWFFLLVFVFFRWLRNSDFFVTKVDLLVFVSTPISLYWDWSQKKSQQSKTPFTIYPTRKWSNTTNVSPDSFLYFKNLCAFLSYCCGVAYVLFVRILRYALYQKQYKQKRKEIKKEITNPQEKRNKLEYFLSHSLSIPTNSFLKDLSCP